VNRHDDDAREATHLLPGLAESLTREDRGWRCVRSWSTIARRNAALATTVAVAIGVALLEPRGDLAVYPAVRLGIGIALLAGASALLVWTIFHPLQRRPLGAARVAAALAVALALPVVFALAPAPHDEVLNHPESFAGQGPDFWPSALACLAFGTALGLPVALFVLVGDRRSPGAAARSWMAAAQGGLAGTLVLLLHCPIVSVGHRLAGHTLVPLAAAAILFVAVRLLVPRD